MKVQDAILRELSSYFTPPYCVFCRKHFIPREDRLNLGIPDIHICSQCLSALPRRGDITLLMSTLDRRLCERVPELARFDAPSIVALEYTELVAHAVRNLKFHEQTFLARPLGYLLAEAMTRSGIIRGDEILLPLPLHPKRKRERGYNQTALIGREIIRFISIDVDETILVRARATQRQSEMDGVLARVSNVDGAFAVRPGQDLSGSRIVVLDDVLTSGATMVSAFKVLKEAGAKEVVGLTLASGRNSA